MSSIGGFRLRMRFVFPLWRTTAIRWSRCLMLSPFSVLTVELLFSWLSCLTYARTKEHFWLHIQSPMLIHENKWTVPLWFWTNGQMNGPLQKSPRSSGGWLIFVCFCTKYDRLLSASSFELGIWLLEQSYRPISVPLLLVGLLWILYIGAKIVGWNL
jgi:hypothetical protein